MTRSLDKYRFFSPATGRLGLLGFLGFLKVFYEPLWVLHLLFIFFIFYLLGFAPKYKSDSKGNKQGE